MSSGTAAPLVRSLIAWNIFNSRAAVFGAAGLAIGVVELEMRTGQVGVELRGDFEFLERGLELSVQLVEHRQVVVGHGLVGHQLRHPLELRDGLIVLGVLLVDDPQVEPGMGNLRVLFLRLLELGDAFFGLRRPAARPDRSSAARAPKSGASSSAFLNSSTAWICVVGFS